MEFSSPTAPARRSVFSYRTRVRAGLPVCVPFRVCSVSVSGAAPWVPRDRRLLALPSSSELILPVENNGVEKGLGDDLTVWRDGVKVRIEYRGHEARHRDAP